MIEHATKVAAAGLLLVLAGAASASECLPRLRDGWIRLGPGAMAMPMLAGYGRIENPCAKPVIVVGARSGSFADVSVHRTSIDDGMSRMRPVAELAIAAGDSASFAPGGLHLMLIEPTQPLKADTKIPVVFRLQDGREFRGELVVRGAAP